MGKIILLDSYDNYYNKTHYYNLENSCIYAENNKIPLFDFSRDFYNLSEEIQEKICNRVLRAYYQGIEKEQVRILKKIDNFIKE